MDAPEVEARLCRVGTGAFLIRQSKNRPGNFTLAIYDVKCHHIAIFNEEVYKSVFRVLT
jgi:hypothetical protein